jgi:hypothetical protein
MSVCKKTVAAPRCASCHRAKQFFLLKANPQHFYYFGSLVIVNGLQLALAMISVELPTVNQDFFTVYHTIKWWYKSFQKKKWWYKL